MNPFLRQIARGLISTVVRWLGRPLTDQRTGQPVGRAFVIPGTHPPRILGIHFPYLRPVFLPESATRYGRQRLGFATHPPVSYPSIRPSTPRASKPNLLWVILLHQTPSQCQTILDRWKDQDAVILPIHGGHPDDATGVIHVSDPALRTKNHPLEKQSYRAVWKAASEWMTGRDFSHVAFAEYDHIPLTKDYSRRLVDCLGDADAAFPHLYRVDSTSAPHYLHHLCNADFACGPWAGMSLREDPLVVLNGLATGSCWTREAFDAVAESFPKCPVYLEMDLPSTSHHLGFRVKSLPPEVSRFIRVNPYPHHAIEQARSAGAWSIHPIKFP